MNHDSIKQLFDVVMSIPENEDQHACGFECYVKPIEIPDFVKKAMEIYVRGIDNQLRQCEQYGDTYIRLILSRFCTYYEYSFLLSGNVSERDYLKHRVFEYFRIRTNEQRQFFIAERKRDNVFQAYCEDLLSSQVQIKDFFLHDMRVPISDKDMEKHTIINAQSGAGKSELLKLLFYDKQAHSQKSRNKSLILIDPHGDLAEEIRDFVLNTEHDRLVYIDPTLSKEYTPIINPFNFSQKDDDRMTDIHAQSISDVFKQIIQNSSMSLNMDTIIKPCIYTLIKHEGTFNDLQWFMDNSKEPVDKRDMLIGKGIVIPHYKEFFQNGFIKQDYRATKHSIYTKIQSLLNSQIFCRTVNGRSTIDLEKEIDAGKVIIFNLAKGKLGTDCSNVLGKMVVAMLQSIALRRAFKPKSKRKPFYTFIDEFQNYTSESMEEILSESRKYKMHMVMAHQTYGQKMSNELQNIVMSNTNVKIVGQNSMKTLKAMSGELGVPPDELKEMKKYHFYAKAGSTKTFVFKTPNILVKNRRYYLNKKQREELERYLIHESGYYSKIERSSESNPTKQATEQETNLPPTLNL